MILILSHPRDPHAVAVTRALAARGRECRTLWLDALGQGAFLSVEPGSEAELVLASGERVDLERVERVWARRVPAPDLPLALGDPDDRYFVANEWSEAVSGALSNLGPRVISPLDRQMRATKPHQLALARRIGMRVPPTLITNDRGRAERFIAEHDGAVVHKTLTGPLGWAADTRSWNDHDRGALAHLAVAPTIFQARVNGPADVRVSAFGERLFAARVETRQGRSPVDSRLDLDAPCSVASLPPAVAQQSRALLEALGLVMGTLDFKVTEDGEHVFLEVNPQGQFLYVEILTGLPLAAAMADLLVIGHPAEGFREGGRNEGDEGVGVRRADRAARGV